VSAERFQGNFLYTAENARLWRGMLEEATDVFGPAVQQGFCYWATDPSDNPDYPKFLEDYYFLTGNLPQTTTAAPLKDLAWTRRIMHLFDKYRCVSNRFSILTLGILDRVHATFTAEELMGVELVLQNREALQSKATVGRARKRTRTPHVADGCDDAVPEESDCSTIACVSGFLINIVKRNVQLITPTRGSDRWPLGYRIFGERYFVTPRDFRAALEDLIATHMPENLSGNAVLSFRDDLSYQRNPDGFELRSSHSRFTFGGACAGLIGDLIRQGGVATVGEIETAVTRAGGNIFVVADTLQKLFDRGLLNDDQGLGGTGVPRPSNGHVALASLAK
jgi:radical SAM family RiPP maturation amino acid epimerase